MSTGEAFRGSLLTRHFVSQVLGRAFAGRLGEESVAAGRRRCGRWWRAVRERLGPASGVRAVWEVAAQPLFAQVGYAARVVRMEARGVMAETRGDFVVARLEAGCGVGVMLVVAPWQERLDRVARIAMASGVEAGWRWAVCFNGHQLRVVDVDRPYARRFVEFDLRAAIEEERGFWLLWALLRPEALLPSARPLARSPVRQPARQLRGGVLLDEIVAACDAHGGSVREALQDGVRRALSSLAVALARADRRNLPNLHNRHAAPAADVVAQALTMIYRLLFLLFAEARALVPVWHPIYRDSYSIGALHVQAQAERHQARGLWAAMQAVSRLAHDGCVTEDLAVTAFNGQLFSPEHTPLGEHLQIPSAIVADILDALMMTPAARGNGRGRERITYADLGVEQLGTVYEQVLDYAPSLEADISQGRAGLALPLPLRLRLPPKRAVSSARRKESGSFYTPRSMADYLVRATLAPLVSDATADDILSLRVLDPAMGSGAFLVSACRYLSWAHAQACERDGCGPAAASPTSEARAEVRRHIARHCLFGVDLNPMAVQLARLSVWLTTMRRDAPLTFLDHHLRAGDSLVGASLEDIARKRLTRSRSSTASLPLFVGDEPAQLMRAILPARSALAAEDDSPATVREKERMLHALNREGTLARWLQLADGWCASWFVADTTTATRSPPPAAAFPAIADYLLHAQATFPAATLDGWLDSIRQTAARRRFFHWTLEFPEVFFDAGGQPLANAGFDAIVGNPPWDMIRNDGRNERSDGTAEKAEKEAGALSRFVREAGIYRCAGDAHFNCYQLFVERSLGLLKRGGRLGLVLPWGIAADHGSARLRRQLLESCDLDTLVSFENTRAIFPIHRSTRFVLLTATTGRATRTVRCRFGQRDPAVLDTPDTPDTPDTREGPGAGGAAAISISVDLLRHVSGEGLAFPDARGAVDIALLERLHSAHPALSSPDGWHVKFGRELNVTTDRGLIEPIRDPAAPANARIPIPVIDGKHLHPFAISHDAITHVVRSDALRALHTRLPDIARPRLAFRDIASPTNRLTLIAALLPANTVSTHTLSVLKSPLAPDAQWCLCALLNSFVANYLIRLRVSTHVTLALMERLPVPRPLEGSTLFIDLADLARRLSVRDGNTDADAYARLQARAAQAYGLTQPEFDYVLGTFPLINENIKDATKRYFVPGTGAAAM
jgi:hypothetical protein